MNRKQFLIAGVMILSLLATLSLSGASAAPVNAPSAQNMTLSCAANDLGIDTITAIVMDNGGEWSAGHIVAINGELAKMTGIPLELHGTVTDSSGNVVASFDQVKPGKRNGISDTLQCTETESFTDDQGNTLNLSLTVGLFVAPRG